MLKRVPFLIEILTAVGLIAAPFVLPYFGFAPNTVNRILVWGLFGIGFDILFGYTGLISFGQSAFFGTGGFIAAYLLTVMGFPHVVLALIIGMIVASIAGYLVGLVALRRTGIYFAMITVAIAEVFYFIEFSPLSDYTGGENGLPGASISASQLSILRPAGRCIHSSLPVTSSVLCSHSASCVLRSGLFSGPFETIHCARAPWATTCMPTS